MFPGGYSSCWCWGEPSTCLVLQRSCQADELLAVLSALVRFFIPLLFIQYSLKIAFFFTSPLGKTPEPWIWLPGGQVTYHVWKPCLALYALLLCTIVLIYLSASNCCIAMSLKTLYEFKFLWAVIILYVFLICESILQVFTSVTYTKHHPKLRIC